jgi:trigger factor
MREPRVGVLAAGCGARPGRAPHRRTKDRWHNGRAVKTSVEELAPDRVRLNVEVGEHDVEHAIEHAASDLASSAKIPGFRKGKVPLPVIVARVGRDAIWEEALRGHLEGWFWSAAASSGVEPLGSPELDLGDAPEDGGTYAFSAEFSVVSPPEVGEWEGLEVPYAEPELPEGLVERELEALRASVAELVPAGDRPAAEGDTVVVDIVGEKTGEQLDYVTEVGSGRLLDELDEALAGMTAGETRTVTVPLEEGEATEIELTVRDVKERVLPPLDDDLARAASEFDTLAELRADIEGRLRDQLDEEAEAAFREATVDTLVEATRFDAPPELVDRRAAELWSGLTRSLARRGIAPEVYLTMTGQSEEEVVARLRAEGERAVKRELVLDGVAAKLGLEVPDEELDAFVREQAEQEGEDADATIAALRTHGTYESLRRDLRLRKALDEVAGAATRIEPDLAAAREKLWTPEKENHESGVNIWTPGSEEAPKP